MFDEIERKSEFIFFYYTNVIDENKKVRIHIENQTIDKILDQLFANTDNIYTIDERQIYIARKQAAIEQQSNKIKVSGTVLDHFGEPIMGANVVEKGTTNGNITDQGGKFSLDVSQGATLVISFIGYVSQEVSVRDQRELRITLLEDAQALDDVVVVAYGTQKKATLTGSIANITTNDLKQSPTANLTNALAGRLPGLIATQFAGGETGADFSEIIIRGMST
ncbi:MAG: carboxypeptidase-like regulatory domain-containing protein, partial [Tannerellaceae bacterium]|nr:carboxypeptidase-like regulatory domain-containing protein [Tannerellaceae bacterium]